jgi:hypothetical protein
MTLNNLKSLKFVLQEGFASIDSSPYVIQQREMIQKEIEIALLVAEELAKTRTPVIELVVRSQSL